MGYRILVVEDEDLIRRGILLSIDWHALDCSLVDEASNGQEALDMIKDNDYDIVIMDINIPLLDGLSVLEQTWEAHEYVPIILSGYADFDFARQAIAFRTDSYLLKPVNLDHLKDAIRRAQKESDRRQALKDSWLAEHKLKHLFPRSPRIHSAPVTDILNHIEKHFGERITIRQLADQLFYSETFLIRQFRQETGLKFTDYLNRFRIKEAIPLLFDSAYSMDEISELCGFSSYKYFNTVFKKYMGCSAREFREKRPSP